LSVKQSYSEGRAVAILPVRESAARAQGFGRRNLRGFLQTSVVKYAPFNLKEILLACGSHLGNRWQRRI